MDKRREGGFIALTSVLIIGAVIIVLGVSMFYASLTDQAISTDYQSSQEANFLADFCLKEGVLKLKADINYKGGEEIKVGDNSCYINLVGDVNGNAKKISSLGKAGDHPYFATTSELVYYAIEPGTEGWTGVDDPKNSKNVMIVNNLLTLTPSQVVEISTTTDTSEDWSASTTAENVDVNSGNLVLASQAPPPVLAANGQSCSNGSECQSNYCVNEVCCGSSSCSTCQACNVSGYEGTCQNVTTNWGAGTYGCTGSTTRCYQGSCKTCDGYLYSDNCSGCAGQGGNACWRYGANNSCNTTCTSYGGCIAANWNDTASCNVALHWQNCNVGCSSSATSTAPYLFTLCLYGSCSCSYRSSGTNQGCADSAGILTARLCICQF